MPTRNVVTKFSITTPTETTPQQTFGLVLNNATVVTNIDVTKAVVKNIFPNTYFEPNGTSVANDESVINNFSSVEFFMFGCNELNNTMILYTANATAESPPFIFYPGEHSITFYPASDIATAGQEDFYTILQSSLGQTDSSMAVSGLTPAIESNGSIKFTAPNGVYAPELMA